jgi:chromatin segregation and condensation protein Rec8/ScpA/Scc1 (kleisin family)
LTLRELLAGAKAKQRYDWDHTADLLSMMANLHTSKSWSRFDFHPTREKAVKHYDLDDPAAEYAELKKQKEAKGKAK